MAHKKGRLHVNTTQRKYKDRVYETHLLRRSYRENGKVKKETKANLSHLPRHIIEIIRRSLNGEKFVTVDEAFEKVDSWHHGHVDAVLRTMRILGFEQLIASRGSRERDLVVAMIVGRIIEPDKNKNSKLANTRWWKITTLDQELNVEGADEDELYATMDWLLERQDRIEKKLAARHLEEGGMVLYDLTSSYFEGVTCPLAALGHPHDGRKGMLQVNYGLLTDYRGCPVAMSVFEGNTDDTKTLMPQVIKMKDLFGIQSMVLVGDRGMITQKLIDEHLKELEGVEWITALRSGMIRKLVNDTAIQLGLFDERNLFEIRHPDFPDERLVACRNPALVKRRGKKRRALLDATVRLLQQEQSVVERGKLRGRKKILSRADKIVKERNVAAHFVFDIRDDAFAFHLNDKQAAAQAALDGACRKLDRIRSMVKRGKLTDKDNILIRAEGVIKKYNIGKHVTLEDMREGCFGFRIDNTKATGEAALDGVYQQLEKLRLLVQRGRFGGKDKIGVRVGKVVNKYKVAKHLVVDIREEGFDFHIEEDKVAAEAALDGVYVVRTSVTTERLSAEDTIRSYKSLSQVERAFLSMKTMDLKARPIRHHLEQRVRAHLFLCMLAYYVEWHMREAWRPLIFADEDQEAKKSRDPVAQAVRSKAASRKARSKVLDDGTQVHSFQTLLKSLSQIVRNRCRLKKTGPDGPTVDIVTTPSPEQKRVFDLLDSITV